MPDEIDSFIGESGHTLSGGQIQRIGVARIFLRNPKIALFDGPTSSSNPKNEVEILAAIQNLIKGRTSILISHKNSTSGISNYALAMKHGNLGKA